MKNTQKPTLKVAQILVVALLGSLMFFTGVVIWLHMTGKAQPTVQQTPGQMNVLLLALLGQCVLEIPVFFVVPMMVVKAQAPRWAAAETDEDRETVVLAALQVISIVRGALVEGAGLFGSVIYLIQGEPLALIAPGIAALVLVALIPTRDKKDALARRLASPM